MLTYYELHPKKHISQKFYSECKSFNSRKFIWECCLPNGVHFVQEWNRQLFSGFLEKEIKKDGIPMLDTGDNPEAPAPREMIDLEVR